MSYNTRRSGGYNNGMNNRGRGGMQQNFIAGGQFQTSQKPLVQAPLRQQQMQQQFQHQHVQQKQQQQQQQHIQQHRQHQQQIGQQVPLPPAPLKSALKKEVKVEPQSPQSQHPPPQLIQHQPQQPQQQLQQQPAIVKQTPVQPVSILKQPKAAQPLGQPQTQQPVQPVAQPPQQPQQPPAPVAAPVQQPLQPPAQPLQQDAEMRDESMGEQNGEVKKKKSPFPFKGKISKKEKRGRRNKRLRKLLQPKNALMVLNELVGGHKFNIEEKGGTVINPFSGEPDLFMANVTIDGNEHTGYGKNKAAAKASAAENALRHIIMSKLASARAACSAASSVDGDGDTSMETEGGADAQQQEEEDLSWLHVASFAMHKLFSSWDTDGGVSVAQAASQLQETKPAINAPPPTRKPAKQLPANPEALNPVMLLKQMRPDTEYEDIAKDGNPPNVMFTVKTVIDNQVFYGKGCRKKLARKNCAYAACSQLYNLTYPKEEYQPEVEAMQLL